MLHVERERLEAEGNSRYSPDLEAKITSLRLKRLWWGMFGVGGERRVAKVAKAIQEQ